MAGARARVSSRASPRRPSRAQLRLRGLVVIDLEEKSAAPSIEELFERLTPVRGRELAGHVAAARDDGLERPLNILRALHVLEEQTSSKPLKRAIIAVRMDVEAGLALSQAMAKHPRVFNEMFVSMVSAGESSGNLDVVLERVAAQLEKDDNLRRTVKSAMMYPALIGGFAVLDAHRHGDVRDPGLRQHVLGSRRQAAGPDAGDDHRVRPDAQLLVHRAPGPLRDRLRLPQVAPLGLGRQRSGTRSSCASP